jgi:hypothetical protein
MGQRTGASYGGGRAVLLAAITVVLALVFCGSALASSAPVVQIQPAEQTSAGFRLKATVNPEGSPTTYYFIYKKPGEIECEDLEGCGPSTPRGGPLTGDTPQEVQAEVTGLTPGTTYTYWLIASNASPEAVRSRELTFTTPPAGSAPVIESVSLSHLTPTDATLEAQIDTEGLATLYQFRLSSICGGRGACLVVIDYPLPSGSLLGSFVDQSVSLDLNSAGVTLQPEGTYSYSVSATNAAGTTKSSVQKFITPEEGIEPLNSRTSTTSSTDQPTGSNGGEQSGGSGGSASASSLSPTPIPDAGVLGTQIGNTNTPKPLTRAQRLAGALKSCAKKPKDKRAACEAQAHKRYGPAGRRVR